MLCDKCKLSQIWWFEKVEKINESDLEKYKKDFKFKGLLKLAERKSFKITSEDCKHETIKVKKQSKRIKKKSPAKIRKIDLNVSKELEMAEFTKITALNSLEEEKRPAMDETQQSPTDVWDLSKHKKE